MEELNLNIIEKEDFENFEILEDDRQEQQAEKSNTKVANWCGTWNNPTMTDDEFCKFFEALDEQNILQYAIFQREKGEETGTIHFQFYVNFKNARYFTWVKKILPYGCHFKPMISTKTRCRNYCSKPDTRVGEQFYEIGEFIEERGRSDLTKILTMLDEGVPLRTVAKIYQTQCIMYKKQLEAYVQDRIEEKEENNFRKLNVVYIYGKTGEGKTRYVMDKHGYANVYRVKFYDQRAFDKYRNQKVILFDEFRSSFKITDMLHYLDGYPLELPCRFFDRMACYTQVYIITNIPLEQQYTKIQEDEKETWNAFKRRINKVINFDNAEQRRELKFGKFEQMSLPELIPIEDVDMPF